MGLVVGNHTVLASIRTRILLTCVAIVVGALTSAGGLNYLVTRSYNDESIRQNLQSVARGHIAGIDDWVASKTQMMASLQDVAVSADPIPVFKAVHKAGASLTSMSAIPTSRTNSRTPKAFRRRMTRPRAPGTSRRWTLASPW